MNPPPDRSSSRSLKERLFHELPRKIFSSRFFTVSALLHFILVLVFGGTIITRQGPPEDLPDGDLAFSNDSNEPVRPPTDPVPTENSIENLRVEPSNAGLTAIRTEAITGGNSYELVIPSDFGKVMPVGPLATGIETASVPVPSPGKLSPEQREAIKVFTRWVKPGSRPGQSVRETKYEFTIFLAKYGDPDDPERGGDWASTHRIKEGKITGGSLPNLVYLMNKMSNGKLEASLGDTPIDLASDEIFAKRPPFIFVTGHRNFVLTEKEVENLRKYVSLGGCIWGDSSLPGQRSRFDIAFRREMRRVMSDVDKQWEVLPAGHPMFTRNLYFPEIKTVPPGMSFYKEPVYALKYEGEVAVIYTANDYGDLWQIGLDEKGKLDFSRDEHGHYVAMNRGIWDRREIFFRNVEEASVLTSYKFGANVVTHLLTRWEERLGRPATGL